MTSLLDMRIQTWRGLYGALLDDDSLKARRFVDAENFEGILPGTERLNWEQFRAETRQRREASGATTVDIAITYANTIDSTLVIFHRTETTTNGVHAAVEAIDVMTLSAEGKIKTLLVILIE